MPTTYTCFISYRSADAHKVDPIAHKLNLLTFPDGKTPRYITWQDKKQLPPAAPNWWDAIVKAIGENKVFVFFISVGSLTSEVCRAELQYAYERNRPIIPIVLEGEYFLNNDKYDLPEATWKLMPTWLKERQFLFDTGAGLYEQFNRAIAEFEQNFPRDVYANPPRKPGGTAPTNHAEYATAVDYAQRMAFDEAKTLFHNLLTRQDRHYGNVSGDWINLLTVYQELLEVHQHGIAFMKKELSAEYQQRFPVDFIDGIFDPHGLFTASTPPPPPPNPLAEKLAQARTFTGKRNTDWKLIIVPLGELVAGTPMPKMEMCLVPVGAFKMGSDSYSDEKPIHPQIITTPYWIARYTVTNAQWREGVQAGAVNEPSYTTWYKDSAMADCPVVYVRWYQALAFAQWARCTLPSELETEYAGRGVESWVYPWGNKYDAKRVVDWHDPTYGDKNPAPVTYKPEGVSWVGAMHLSGNVWEWQRSLYKGYPYQAEDGRENVNENISKMRVLRGGSFSFPASGLRSARRRYRYPTVNYYYTGFRCAFYLNSSGH